MLMALVMVNDIFWGCVTAFMASPQYSLVCSGYSENPGDKCYMVIGWLAMIILVERQPAKDVEFSSRMNMSKVVELGTATIHS